MTKRRYIFAVLIAAITLSIGGNATVKRVNNDDQPSSSAVNVLHLSEPDLTGISFEQADTEALYIDFSASLEEMKQHSDLIIVGRPVSAEQRAASIVSTVEVSQTLQGTPYKTIQLVQLKDDAVPLQAEYIFFLGKQDDGQEDTFFIKGGIQGALFEQDGQWVSRDPLLTEEIAKYYSTDGDTKANLLHFINDSDDAERQVEAPVNEREQTFFLGNQVGWKAEYSAYGMFREDTVLYRTDDGGQTCPEA